MRNLLLIAAGAIGYHFIYRQASLDSRVQMVREREARQQGFEEACDYINNEIAAQEAAEEDGEGFDTRH